MLLEYYSIRIKDAEPGKGLLHSTAHYDEVRSAIKHFKEKHPDKKIVAYKHELKKGPMGMSHKRKEMFKEDTADETVTEGTKSFNTLMRSIQDKKSIKSLKVPSPFERNADGSMKPKEPEKKIQEAASDSFTTSVHSHTDTKGNKWEVRGEKYPNLRRPRHAIFKNGTYHSMAGTAQDARGRVQHLAEDSLDENTVMKAHDAKITELKSLKEETMLSEDVYKVEHEGHPDAEGHPLYKHLPTGKKYTNHITKFPASAKKHEEMLKKAGFKGVKVYKNWKLMEDVELDESNLTPSSIKVKIIKNGNKHELTIRQPNRKVTGYHKSFDSREDAEKFVHMKWGNDALQEETELDESKDPFAGTPWSAKKTKEKLLNDVKKRIGMNKPETKEPKSVVKDGKRVFESVDLEEGKMAELHADIGDHMDKHIANYKKVGGAEALMAHAAKATPKIAKMHGIEHKHAEKFVSDYIESKLNEETLAEAYTGKQYSGSPEKVAKSLSLANKSNGSRVRNDGSLEFHEKDGNKVNVHHVWTEDGGKTSKYTVKTMSKSLHKKNYGSVFEETATAEKFLPNQMSKQNIKVGDSVHVGHVMKGGSGYKGVVTAIDHESNMIHFRSHEKDRFGYHHYRGKLSNATVE